MIELYTDGASRGNPGPGGYGVILKKGGHYKEISEGFRLTTNNRMELMSVIAGLEALKNPNSAVTVFSDSKYVVDAINKGWIYNWEKKFYNKIKNPDLWKRLMQLVRKHNVKFVWIKGHNEHPENERCDELAVIAALGTVLNTDFEYERTMDVNNG
jgi:ribonuclease HI